MAVEMQMSALYSTVLADVYANVSMRSVHVCILTDAESNFSLKNEY